MISSSQFLGGLAAQPPAPVYGGVAIALVTNNQDPQQLGRVKVSFPWLGSGIESDWIRVVTPMAGPNRGFYCLPEVDDEVLVAFEQGNLDFPYVLGTLWNGKDIPPAQNDDGKNNVRLWKSRSGHEIRLDDTEGKEQITIADKSGKNTIVIDTASNTLTITTEKDLQINAKGNISLDASQGDVTIACKNFKVDANQNCDLAAKVQGSFKAQATLALNGTAGVKVNDGALEVI